MIEAQLESTLFYVFSTVSQSLAVAIGLLAAFIVYRLSELDRSLRQHLSFLYARYPQSEDLAEVHFLWSDYDVPKLLAYFNQDSLEILSAGDGLDKPLHVVPARQLFSRRQELISNTRLGLLWTGSVILGALAILSTATLLSLGEWAVVGPVLMAGLIAVAWCLWIYFKLILAAIRPEP